MDTIIYRIEYPDGNVLWSFKKPMSFSEEISYECSVRDFLELDGEVTKAELKGVIEELILKIPFKSYYIPKIKGVPDKISHKIALQMIQHFEDSFFDAEKENVTVKEAEELFQRRVAEIMDRVSGTTFAKDLKDTRDEALIEALPPQEDGEE